MDHASLADWVAREILPHESDLRSWLQRRVVAWADVEDVVQECYCQLSQLTSVAHIVRPRSYLFTMARHLVDRQRKRARVVRIEPLQDGDEDRCRSDAPSPERIAIGRQELDRVQAALDTLSERARRIFMMRRVEGVAQKEIARVLGVSEAVVENEASRSLSTLIKVLTEPQPSSETPSQRRGVRARAG